MSKSEAWDILTKIILDGVNCWDVTAKSDPNEALVRLSYLNGVIEALDEAVSE